MQRDEVAAVRLEHVRAGRHGVVLGRLVEHPGLDHAVDAEQPLGVRRAAPREQVAAVVLGDQTDRVDLALAGAVAGVDVADVQAAVAGEGVAEGGRDR